MNSEHDFVEEGRKLKTEFEQFSRKFEFDKESFYHGTFGRCLKFRVQTLEGSEFELLLHRSGLTAIGRILENFESFEQFFNSKSSAFRHEFSAELVRKLTLARE